MAKQERPISRDMFAAEAHLFTRAGDRVHVRPVSSKDRQRVADLIAHLSADDLRDRFLAEGKALSEEQIDELCRADYPEAMTFLAFHGDEPIALATLSGTEDGKVEVALATVPHWKGRGVSWVLLGHVVNYAADHGAKQIVSVEHGGNRAAITLEHEMGFGIRLLDAGTGEMRATKSL